MKPPGGERICAIHQPNLFPPLTTLAKLAAADVWIILDDVQFARRDYQHRTRLVALHDPSAQQWLTLPVHLPYGRATQIRDVLLIDPRKARRRTERLLAHYYRRGPYWSAVRDNLDVVLDSFRNGDRLGDVAVASALALLQTIGWKGRAVRASTQTVPTGPAACIHS